MKYVLEIPGWRPHRLNELMRSHWSTSMRLKRQDRDTVMFHALKSRLPKAKGKRRVKVTIHGWGRGGQFPDKDAYDKSLLDALVHSGLLVTDSEKGLDGRMEVEFVRSRDNKWLTVIELEDV